MSPQIKNDLLYLLNILQYINKISFYTKGFTTAEDLYERNNQLNLNASLNLLANIGEQVSKISKDLLQKYQKMAWKRIKDFRNRVVHDYSGLDIVRVFGIISKELPLLKSQLITIVEQEIKSGIFDKEEFNSAKNSTHYNFIDFSDFQI